MSSHIHFLSPQRLTVESHHSPSPVTEEDVLFLDLRDEEFDERVCLSARGDEQKVVLLNVLRQAMEIVAASIGQDAQPEIVVVQHEPDCDHAAFCSCGVGQEERAS